MDTWILVTSGASFVLLFLLLLAVFRMVHAYDAPVWYIRMTGFCGVCCLGLWWVVVFLGWVHETPQIIAMGVIASLLLYGLLTILFLFGVFGVFEASITLHILTKIALSGKEGIHPNAILSSYNRNTIVKRRIDRFLWSGELLVVGGRYRLSKRLSYFMMRERFLNILRWMFPTL
ncbi:hypothetical protein A3A63_00640 [Candidatus Gottesmanbacteria bacterium RIFCSPLOWO2_01_FULL_46_9]|uniref:Uncharacterized protein n=1 Tax=Candidatus Gottesmanbacteria bacterium RIFCSPLOWO2_01_FULL_46_9 TaxID=1798394 RepID=A0A1F6B153_9BACT|nr:MAG: hypothetical protein A3A63_00640 [Candidatus Gottesmanbacteria bacterium RIFCSPLOWO2_01_FULL_46_9]